METGNIFTFYEVYLLYLIGENSITNRWDTDDRRDLEG